MSWEQWAQRMFILSCASVAVPSTTTLYAACVNKHIKIQTFFCWIETRFIYAFKVGPFLSHLTFCRNLSLIITFPDWDNVLAVQPCNVYVRKRDWDTHTTFCNNKNWSSLSWAFYIFSFFFYSFHYCVWRFYMYVYIYVVQIQKINIDTLTLKTVFWCFSLSKRCKLLLWKYGSIRRWHSNLTKLKCSRRYLRTIGCTMYVSYERTNNFIVNFVKTVNMVNICSDRKRKHENWEVNID